MCVPKYAFVCTRVTADLFISYLFEYINIHSWVRTSIVICYTHKAFVHLLFLSIREKYQIYILLCYEDWFKNEK